MKKIKLRGFAIVLILLLVVFTSYTSAQAQSSAGLESRLSRLEAENFQLRSQVGRLESQVFRLSQSPSSRSADGTNRQTPPVPNPPRDNRQVSSADPMFNRLATLSIELKERITKLEAQVAELKKKVAR